LKKFTQFGLKSANEGVTGDRRSLTLHYQLNEAANVQDYTIYAAVTNEEEFVVKQIGNEPVVVRAKPKKSGKFS